VFLVSLFYLLEVPFLKITHTVYKPINIYFVCPNKYVIKYFTLQASNSKPESRPDSKPDSKKEFVPAEPPKENPWMKRKQEVEKQPAPAAS